MFLPKPPYLGSLSGCCSPSACSRAVQEGAPYTQSYVCVHAPLRDLRPKVLYPIVVVIIITITTSITILNYTQANALGFLEDSALDSALF